MQDKIFIPSKIKVGYNKREDTYTKKLAYIIYYDAKNVLRQEASWESWREKKLGADDYDNVPTEGFVLNKGVGGARESYGWNTRNEYIRIYDPRGFEFEISVANLLYILQETNSIKGKGLEGEFVYGYHNKKVVLLPVGSSEYKACMKFTETQGKKVASKELILGATYQTKQMENLIYLGRYNCYGELRYNWSSDLRRVSNDYVFYDSKNKQYINQSAITNIASVIEETCHSDFAALVEKLEKKEYVGKIKDKHIFEEGIQFKKGNGNYSWEWDVTALSGTEYSYREAPAEIQKFGNTVFLEISPNTYQVCNLFRKRIVKKKGKESYSSDYEWSHLGYGITSSRIVTFENDEIVVKSAKNPYKDKLFVNAKDLKDLNFKSISVTLKSGKRHKLFKD